MKVDKVKGNVKQRGQTLLLPETSSLFKDFSFPNKTPKRKRLELDSVILVVYFFDLQRHKRFKG